MGQRTVPGQAQPHQHLRPIHGTDRARYRRSPRPHDFAAKERDYPRHPIQGRALGGCVERGVPPRAACGSLSPAQSWARSWDGKWRVLCFDIPARPASRRQKLSRFLHQNKFGLLQRSVWISPDPQEQLLQQFRPEANAHSLLLWEAPTPKGIAPGTFAQLAWDFESVKHSYQKVLNLRAGNLSPNEHLLEITRLWHLAVAQDPLLPRSACPKNYLGFEATAAVEKLWQGFQPARKTSG